MYPMLKLFFVLSALPISVGNTDTSDCPPTLTRNTNLKSFRNTCLRFVTTEKEWTDARDDCKNNGGGLLVQILDAETQSFVVSTLKSLNWDHNGVWIGANDLQKEGTWVWVTGQPVTYSNWLDGAGPHHTGFLSTKYIDDCAQIRLDHGGHWEDKPCEGGPAYHYSFICQYDKISTPAFTSTTKLPTTTKTTSEAVLNTTITEISKNPPTGTTSKGNIHSNFNVTSATDIKQTTEMLIPTTESKLSTRWITRGSTERSPFGPTVSWNSSDNQGTSQGTESQPSTESASGRTTNMAAVMASTYEDETSSTSLSANRDNEVTKPQDYITGNTHTRNSPIILNSIKVSQSNSETPVTKVTSNKEIPEHTTETPNLQQSTGKHFLSSAQNHAFGSTLNIATIDTTRNSKSVTSNNNSLIITDDIVTDQLTSVNSMRKESSTISASGNLVTHSNPHVATWTEPINAPTSENIKQTTESILSTRKIFGQTTNKYNMVSTLSPITSQATDDLKHVPTNVAMTTQSGTGRKQTDIRTSDYIQDKTGITQLDITQSRGNNREDTTVEPSTIRNMESTSYYPLPSKRTSRPFYTTSQQTKETVRTNKSIITTETLPFNRNTTTSKHRVSRLTTTTVKPTKMLNASPSGTDQQGLRIAVISSTKASKLATLTPLLNKQPLSKKKSNTTAILVGAIVGGLVFCIVIIAAVIVMRRKSKHPKEETEDYDVKQSEVTFNNFTYDDWNRDSAPTGDNDA